MGRRKLQSDWIAVNLFEYMKDPEFDEWQIKTKEEEEIVAENIIDSKSAHLIAAAPLLLDTLKQLLLKGGINHANRLKIKKVVSIAGNNICTRNISQ